MVKEGKREQGRRTRRRKKRSPRNVVIFSFCVERDIYICTQGRDYKKCTERDTSLNWLVLRYTRQINSKSSISNPFAYNHRPTLANSRTKSIAVAAGCQ